MMEWLAANGGSLLVGAVLLIIVIAIIYSMIKKSKNGSHCDGNCSCCSGGGKHKDCSS